MRLALAASIAAFLSCGAVAEVRHPPGALIAAHGGEIWREVEGSGAPLVLIAGGPGLSHSYLHPWFSPLAGGNRLVYFDAIGTGRSTHHKTPYTLAEAIEDVDAIRRSLGVPKLSLLGHSYGGYVALGYASRYPGRVDHLIISNIVASGDEQQLVQDNLNATYKRQSPESWMKLMQVRAKGLTSSMPQHQNLYDPPAPMLNFYNPEKAARMPRGEPNFYNPDLWYSMAGRDADFNVAGELRAFDTRGTAKSLPMPMLVLAGRFDRLVYPELIERWRTYAPRAQIHFLEKSGHFPFLEQQTETLEVIRAFLSKPAPSPQGRRRSKGGLSGSISARTEPAAEL